MQFRQSKTAVELTIMTFFMAGQATSFDESSATTRKLAFVRSLACMRISVSLHIRVLGESSRAVFASVNYRNVLI